MKRYLTLIVLQLAILLLAGCASTTQLVPLPDQTKTVDNPQSARIYVIRAYNFLGSAGSLWILDDHKHIGNIGVESYLCWERPAGKTTITSDASGFGGGQWKLDLNLQSGSVYYLEQTIGMGDARITLLDAEKGQELLRKCKAPQVPK
jgi:hypothetical protein